MDWLTRKLKPMLVYFSPPFDSPEYIMEVKWDGTRCLAFIDRGLRLQNRRLLEIDYRYPELHDLPRWIKAREVILDGEIVILVNGKPSFSELQEREHISEENRIKILSRIIPATYIVFDLLYLNGKSLINEPLSIRKELLKSHVIQNEFLVISQFVDQYGIKFYQEAVALGLEGIMAKRKSSRYLIGKRSEDCPFTETPEIARSVQWVRPEIVCEVEFMEWTEAKKLSAPRYRRLRGDKPVKECVILKENPK